ncbi:DUF2919 domain-containing protein [Salmonella enterica subsp. enterica serovar Teko]|nr:DUF2919 family protein [Salmonella enterica subsp. enterica serovar Teko]EHE7852542.1 DUF2919 domain-containing protein [Salmonella enterica subsp. enterica serovar Teko]
MMRDTAYQPDDFDDNGLLKAPVLFWIGLVLLARAWWFVMLMNMTTSGDRWQLSSIWPDIRLQLVAFGVGIPGMVMLFVYPLRDRLPGFSRFTYVLILVALLVMVLVNLTGLMSAPPCGGETGWVFLCLDMANVVMLWPDARLRRVFLTRDCDDQQS